MGWTEEWRVEIHLPSGAQSPTESCAGRISTVPHGRCAAAGFVPCPAKERIASPIEANIVGMRLGSRYRSQQSLVVGGLFVASVVRAAAPAQVGSVARVAASGGQAELVVGFDAKGSLRAAVCHTSGCAVDTGIELTFPDVLLTKRSVATLQVIPIGERRSAVHVSIPTDQPGNAWQAVILARPGQPKAEIVFAGMTGYVEGEEGLRHGPTVEVSEPIDETGTRRIVVGEQREDLTLCGRPAVLSPKMLTAKDFALKPAKVQRLSADERDHAPKLIAEPHAPPASRTPDQPTEATGASRDSATASSSEKVGGQASLLRAIGATSAIGWPAHLTDGNVETTWAENRGGAGRGEFVSFHAPSDVPLQSFDFVVRPVQREIAHGVGPEKLWLVTNKRVFLVSFPSDPWKAPGVRWKVALPAPVQTDCVAIVTETAYGEKPDSEVTLAEVNARSEFTTASIENLVGALAGGGPRADAAGTVLAGLGPDAFLAVAKAFDQLDEGGRRVALDILDHAPCTDSSPVYVAALLGRVEAHRMHAIDRLHRCGVGAVASIEQALANQPIGKLHALAELLAEVAPDKAMRLLVPRLTGPNKTRRMLREVIGKAARSPKSRDAILELLGRSDLPNEATVDLMRALGTQLNDYSGAAAANIERLLTPSADFRTKFLLLGPAHTVCDKHPALAKSLSGIMKTDPSPLVRVEAVRTATHLGLFAADLMRAIEDPDVRVRQAAAQNLAGHKHAETILALSKRLKQDDWPIVRVAAAESLSAQPADTGADKALILALADDSSMVKVAAADAVATRKVAIAGEPLLDLFSDKKERFEVRIAAARALGEICYDRALDKLTNAAKTLRSPSPDARDRAVASSALDALAKLHPSDLAARLEPLLGGRDTPAGTRQAARAALAAEPHCRVPAALTTASVGGR
jgi:HEAT repeat protein